MVKNFTNEDDENLAIYIAVNDPREADGRMQTGLYKQLVENPDQLPWAARHTWMSWMTRYINHHESFDRRIRAIQDQNSSDHIFQSPSPNKLTRTKFTAREDENLVKFLAQISSSKQSNTKHGRSGNLIYQDILVANLHKYPWAKSHTWQSWRNRYVKRSEHFDTLISLWQEKYDVDLGSYRRSLGDPEEPDSELGQTDTQLRALDESQRNAEHSSKRRRLEEEEETAEIVSNDLPQSKRQKLSPGSGDNETEEPTEIAQRNDSISPVGLNHSINSGERQGDIDQLVTVTGHQELGACEVGEDKKYDERSSRRSDHLDGRQGPVPIQKDCHEYDKPLPAPPKRNNSSEDHHIRAPPNTPAYLENLNSQFPAPSKETDTLGDVRASNTTSVNIQVPIKQPTALPPPSESSPTRIPGDCLDISRDPIEVPKISRHLTSRPITVRRSHHPTPPSTNEQSEWSHPSSSTSSDSSMLTAKAEGKGCQPPSLFPVYGVVSPSPSPVDPAATHPDQLMETHLASAKPPLFASPTSSDTFLDSSSLPQRIADLQELETNSPPHSPGGTTRSRTPKKDGGYESSSDDPFTSSSPSPRRIEVIRGLPKARPGMSFRGSNWVRERRVVSGTMVQKGLKRDATTRKGNDDEGARSHKNAPAQMQEVPAEKRRSNSPRLLDFVSNNSRTGGSTPNDTTDQHFNRSAPSSNSKHVNSGQQNANAAGATPIPANHESYPIGSKVEDVLGDIPSQSHHFKEDDMAKGRKVTDVFRTFTPVASGRTYDPYVLNTSHLPEPSSASSAIHLQLDSPVPRHKIPRDKSRRQTFSGFKSRSSLPNIDLMKKLGERSSTRTAARLWTRRTSLDNTSSSDSILSITRTPLDTPERRITHYRPLRSSVIPVLANPASPHSASALLTKLSPSTYNHVIRAGLGVIFKRMEENHGFSTSVVQRAWLQQNMDLDATDRMLLQMRIAAENASHSDDYREQPRDLASNRVLEGTRNEVPSLEYMAPDPDAVSDDYTPPAHSRAEQYRNLLDHGHFREAQQREIERISRGSSKSSRRKKISPPTVWGAKDDEVLQSGDKTKLETLAHQFGEDTVRRRFLSIMRKSCQ